MFKWRQLTSICLISLLLSASSAMAGGDAPEYDMNSWKTMIADECRAFFDGCNQCSREPGKMAACTRMACAEYRKPECRDEAASGQTSMSRTVEYVCADGARFSLIYNLYETESTRVRLGESEVMLRDMQTYAAHRLQRERSASGEKYSNSSGLQFFGKGKEGMVMQGAERLYSDCLAG